MRSRLLFRVLGVVTLTLTLQLVPSASAVAPGGAPQGLGISQRVIIVLKNQEPNLRATAAQGSARRAAIAQDQQPLVSQLHASAASNVHPYTLIDAVSATVPTTAIGRLKSNPAVAEVVPDQVLHVPASPIATAGATGAPAAPLPGACARPGQVQLNPEALQTIAAASSTRRRPTARSLGFDGRGVKVAFIADGLDVNNPDFIRTDRRHVFVDYRDFSGQGTAAKTLGEEAFGDASAIAAQGRQVYDVSHYSALPLSRRCLIRVEGVAPGANLVALSVFVSGASFNSALIQAIDYAVTHDHVQVLNESLGSNYYPDDAASMDIVKRANDAAVAAGTTVTTSAGDAGITSTIDTPASDPKVISVGATSTYRLLAQDGLGGARLPRVGRWLNDNIASFSSAGFVQAGGTVDVVGPGQYNWALCAPKPQYASCVSLAGKRTRVQAFSGTSQAAPLTAGVAALVIQAFRKTHGASSPSPALVKQLILSTADDIGAPAEQQGTGRINAYRAVLAAESYRLRSSAGQTLLLSATQLNLTGAPGSSHSLTDSVTNNGNRSQRLTLRTRAVGSYTRLKLATVRLSDSSSRHVVSSKGLRENLVAIRFRVPAGQNRLNAALAFQGSGSGSPVQLTLVDPHGALAAVAAPEGQGNYNDAQVTDPAPGAWTAYVFSPEAQYGGTVGPVVFGASAARYISFGSVTPSTLTLAPGQSRAFTFRITTPVIPGDSAGSIVLSTRGHSGSGQLTTVPVTLRNLIGAGHQAFSQTLTGGNGRTPNTGQSFYYQLRVPPGQRELNASVKLARNPNNPFEAWLVSPSGNTLAFSTSRLMDFSGHVTNEIGSQLHVLSPPAGTWTLIVTFAPSVSGTALSDPFTVATDDTPVLAQAPGLPDSPSVTLAAGTPHSYSLHLVNHGPGPDRYFVDARLPRSTRLVLAAYPAATNEPITGSSPLPRYLVPTHTTAWLAAAGTPGPRPIEFDVRPVSGDPDIGSTAGRAPVAAYGANPVGQGFWNLLPQEIGPFGNGPGPSEPANTAMLVATAAFDPAVRSPTGDLWLSSANKASQYHPLLVGAGGSATIPVTITPSAPAGTTVTGTLYIDDVSFVQGFDTGDEVAAIPYSYTVK